MREEAFVAARSLTRSRLVLTLLLMAVTAAVAFQIPTNAALSGYARELERTALTRDLGHIQVTSEGAEPFESGAALKARVDALPFVRRSAVRLVQAGVIQHQGELKPVWLNGVDPAGEDAMWGFCTQIAEGECIGADSGDALVLGRTVAEQLDVVAGDRIKIVVPYEDLGSVGLSTRTYRVAGILKSGGSWGIDWEILVPVKTLWHILDREDLANRVAVLVDDIERVDEYLPAVQALVTPGTAKPWYDIQSFVRHAIDGTKSLAWLTTGLVCLGTMLPVLALMYILVLRERRHIAVLAALGFSRGSVFSIYVWKAALVGLTGVVLGGLIGVGLTMLTDRYPIYDYRGFTVRPVVHLWTVAGPIVAVLAATLLAGLLPAALATRANPSVVLREE